MLAKLKAIFSVEEADNTVDNDERMRLACAALMTEVATIDNHFDEKETAALISVLKTQFQLNDGEAQNLKELAEQERHDATSLHQFTSLVNEHCGPEEKFALVEGMWKVAYADGHIDKYEEHIIRRASELIYLSHSDFIRAKLSVKNAT